MNLCLKKLFIVNNKTCIIDLNLLILNKKQVINFLNLSNYFQQALKRKNIFLDFLSYAIIGKNLYVSLKIYYTALKLFIFKKKLKLFSAFINNKSNSISSTNLFFPNKFIKLTQLNNSIIKLINLNSYINFNKVNYLYKNSKNLFLTFFKKKHFLFMDLLNITILLLDFKANLKLFSNIFMYIFAPLSKKQHNRFFLLLKKYLTLILENLNLNNNNSVIKGFKFRINGRLRGKTRADVKNLIVGTVPLQTNQKYIEFYKQHIFTIYGVFGLKIWIYRLNSF